MKRYIIDVENYWRVIVYFDIDYDSFDIISEDLAHYFCPKEEINSIWNHINTDAKAFTFSNINLKISIVGFNEHENKYDYINSIVHECEHIKQSMLRAYYINDSGEPPAYTIGYLVSKMLSLNNKLCY